MKELKKRGFKCAIVEKFNAFAPRKDGRRGIRVDLFGIIDILVLDHARGFVGVQSTGQDFAGHHRKLTEEKAAECIDWLTTPNGYLELWGWRKVKRKGRMVWRPRIKEYTLADFIDPFEG